MPTDTKNTDENRSFTGCTMRSILAASEVSANSDPMTNAPSAEEKPALTAIITMPRHRPSEPHEQDFVGDVAVYLLQQRGYQVDAQYRPEDEEGGQLEHALEHRHALELLAGGQRGKHHQHDYAHEVLDDEDAQGRCR